MAIQLYITPQPEQFPARGGVREHLIQLYRQARADEEVTLVDNPARADIVHVESSWPAPSTVRPMVYVCHGGFIPSPPILTVMRNLQQATIIVTVAYWMSRRYFPDSFYEKTVHIPNGVLLDEFKDVPSSPLEPGGILYAKEWDYHMEDFLFLARACPNKRFITTYWPTGKVIPENVTYVGLQSREAIKSVLSGVDCLMLTGSEVCPTMLLEAWALKKPVLAKNIDGSRELMVWGGVTGGGVLYNGQQDVEEKLHFVLARRFKLGKQGYDKVRTYDWRDIWQRYKDLYEKVLLSH